ncbi:hypothetical protein PENSTE_c002G00234 [Penicillium steckii]|uniref:Pre-mRNA-splicing factor 38B n=1 Tax=Penicillium steckii TaxID=303698 RepID=A0A1V6TVB0_9EURO|nr:hypothetical protein PENSTE_c002G00234 [Penicillium steckii]
MDDDYVAQLMAKEAKETSQKYSVEGLAAFKSKKRDANAPRANTRFLRHLIKETDNHNTALKRKEEREARDRMRQSKSQSLQGSSSRRLSLASGRHDREHHSSARDSERRNREDNRHSRHDDRRGSRRDDDDRSHRRNHRHRSRSTSSERSRSRRHRRRDKDRSRSRDTDKDGERSYRRGEDNRDRRRNRDRDRDREHGSSRRSRHHRRRNYSESRSRSPRRDRSLESQRNRHNHKSSGDRSSHSHRIEEEQSRRDRDKRPPRESNRMGSHNMAEQRNGNDTVLPAPLDDDEVDSDPLEDIIGPPPPQPGRQSEPPIRSRGRGAYKPSASNIDSHFAPDYDPTVDLQPDEDEPLERRPTRRAVPGLMTEEDDWDMALEALRDRARWKQKGEERLRAAGLNESIIDRWKDNTTSMGPDGEKSLEDVRWSKKGEGREWDRGKVIDDQGHTDVHASW